MRQSEVIIGKVQEENIGNGIREMAEFGRAGGLDSRGGCFRGETRAALVMLSSAGIGRRLVLATTLVGRRLKSEFAL